MKSTPAWADLHKVDGYLQVIDVPTQRVGRVAACVGPLVTGQLSQEWMDHHQALGVEQFYRWSPQSSCPDTSHCTYARCRIDMACRRCGRLYTCKMWGMGLAFQPTNWFHQPPCMCRSNEQPQQVVAIRVQRSLHSHTLAKLTLPWFMPIAASCRRARSTQTESTM